ncbi:TPA: DNA mismatch endonuclease Vsr [Legionella pneumophila]|nr:DNA mismatch endonuclease Vsr [Legionella pneumophila]
MPDIVEKAKRSEMMSGIRSKNTKPELIVRKELFAKGLRYRLHLKNIPGKPDIIFKKYKAVIFIHGCFWHCHDCHLFKWPQTRQDFWHNKILSNKQRDINNRALLEKEGWRVAVVWECALKGKSKLDIPILVKELEFWLHSSNQYIEIPNNIL